ncbi:MAG: hypothetical protein H0U44_10535 [Flavisolibacter sp.]|jgi:hypothetical protein|nr:hypothetical protein [Flavisolibacter sp.]
MAEQTFREYLEEQMDMKRNCTIRFRDVEGGVATLKAHILDVKTEATREMIQTDAGIHIGIDQILQVNDRVADNYC